MYKILIGVLFSFLVFDIAIALGGFDDDILDSTIGIGISIFVGIIGNSTYRTMAKKNIRTLQTQYLGIDLLTEVEKRGGESSKGVLVAILLVFRYGTISTVSTTFIDRVKNPVGIHETASDYSALAIKVLNVATYFPTIGMTRSYVNFRETDNVFYSSDQVYEVDASYGPKRIEIFYYDEIVKDSFKQYVVTKDEVRNVHIRNALFDGDENELVLTNQSEWETGDGDDSISYITETDLPVEVPAGIFKQSIKVVNEVHLSEGVFQIIDYHAPGIGVFKTDFIDGKGEAGVFKELDSYTQGDGQLLGGGTNRAVTYTNKVLGFSFEYPEKWGDEKLDK